MNRMRRSRVEKRAVHVKAECKGVVHVMNRGAGSGAMSNEQSEQKVREQCM